MRAARYTGYRRLLDRMAVGLPTTLEAMDTDPGAALVSYIEVPAPHRRTHQAPAEAPRRRLATQGG